MYQTKENNTMFPLKSKFDKVNTTIQDKIELLEEVQQAEIQFENGQGLCNADARAQVLAQLNK